MKKLMPILAVIVLIAGVGLGLFGKSALDSGAVPFVSAKESPTPAAKEKEPEAGIMFPLRERIVNLADPGMMRYLKTTIVLELEIAKGGSPPKGEEYKKKQEELKVELTGATPIIEDQVTTLLSSKSSAELMTNDGKQKLREELKARIGRVVHEPKVLAVYFTDFIIQ